VHPRPQLQLSRFAPRPAESSTKKGRFDPERSVRRPNNKQNIRVQLASHCACLFVLSSHPDCSSGCLGTDMEAVAPALRRGPPQVFRMLRCMLRRFAVPVCKRRCVPARSCTIPSAPDTSPFPPFTPFSCHAYAFVTPRSVCADECCLCLFAPVSSVRLLGRSFLVMTALPKGESRLL
jgi:hypothetical protein